MLYNDKDSLAEYVLRPSLFYGLPLKSCCLYYAIKLKHQQEEMKLNTQFTESYIKYGMEILSTPLHDSVQSKIAQLLPHQFNGEDIGSPICGYSDQIVKEAGQLGKTGKFVVIDPFPLQQRVIKSSGQDYVRKPSQKKVDLIITKFVLHLVPNIHQFLQNVHKRLSDDGVLVAVTLTAKTTLPWGKVIQKGFQRSVFNQAHFDKITNIFEIEEQREIYNKYVTKESVIGLVKNRGWTNLYSNTDQQINESVEMIRALPEQLLQSTITTNVFCLRKRK